MNEYKSPQQEKKWSLMKLTVGFYSQSKITWYTIKAKKKKKGKKKKETYSELSELERTKKSVR